MIAMSVADGLRLMAAGFACLLLAGCEEPAAPANSEVAPSPAVTVVAATREAVAPTTSFTSRVEVFQAMRERFHLGEIR